MKDNKLPERFVQLISVLGLIGLTIIDVGGYSDKPVPNLLYYIFAGGFFAGYSITDLAHKFINKK